MSCWWDLDFSVTGPESLTEQLKAILADLKFDDGARLFHHVEIVNYLPGFIVVHASRNYHGGAAIGELIARFPDMAFQGSLHSDVGYDHYTLFCGQNGETTFQDLVIPDFEERLARRPTPDEIAERITELDDKIYRLGFERKELMEYRCRHDIGPAMDQPAGNL